MQEKVSITINGNEKDYLDSFYLNDISRKKFYDFLSTKHINLANLFGPKPSLKEKHAFNLFLRNVTTTGKLSLSDCLIFLEERYYKFKKIISLLDEENYHNLKEELSSTYNIKLPKNSLIKFLVYDG